MKLGDLNNTEGVLKSFYVLIGDNMGNKTIAMDMSINEFRDISTVRNQANEENIEDVAQREINPTHVKGLAIHILVGLIHTILNRAGDKVDPVVLDIQKQVGQSSYAVLQPFVCNIRNCERDGSDLEVEKVASNDPNANLYKIAYLIMKMIFLKRFLYLIIFTMKKIRKLKLVLDLCSNQLI